MDIPKRRVEKKLMKNSPKILFQLNSINSSSFIEEKCSQLINSKAIYPLDLQKLLLSILFAQFGQQHCIAQPRWCLLTKPQQICQIKLVIVEHCDWSLLSEDETSTMNSEIVEFHAIFNQSIPIVSPAHYKMDFITELTTTPLSFLSLKIRHTLAENSILNLNRKIRCITSKTAIKSDDASKRKRMRLSLSESLTDSNHSQENEQENNQNFEESPEEKEVIDRTQLLLNKAEMKREGIKLPQSIDEETNDDNNNNNNSNDRLDDAEEKDFDELFKLSKPEGYISVHSSSPMFAVDCEMVGTKKPQPLHTNTQSFKKEKSELARICVIREDGSVAYSSFVRPRHPVSDYRTWVSGVTARDLSSAGDSDSADPRRSGRGGAVSLSRVQHELSQLLPRDAILVGHSICFDLSAMRIFHPYVIDTSAIFRLNANCPNRKPSLKQLAALFLNRSIQSGKSGKGHSPEEDARAALDLVKLKLCKGVEFGDETRFGEQEDKDGEEENQSKAKLHRDFYYSWKSALFEHNDDIKSSSLSSSSSQTVTDLQRHTELLVNHFVPGRCVSLFDDVIDGLLLADKKKASEKKEALNIETNKKEEDESNEEATKTSSSLSGALLDIVRLDGKKKKLSVLRRILDKFAQSNSQVLVIAAFLPELSSPCGLRNPPPIGRLFAAMTPYNHKPTEPS